MHETIADIIRAENDPFTLDMLAGDLEHMATDAYGRAEEIRAESIRVYDRSMNIRRTTL